VGGRGTWEVPVSPAADVGCPEVPWDTDVPIPCEWPRGSDAAVDRVVEAGDSDADIIEPRRLFLPFS